MARFLKHITIICLFATQVFLLVEAGGIGKSKLSIYGKQEFCSAAYAYGSNSLDGDVADLFFTTYTSPGHDNPYLSNRVQTRLVEVNDSREISFKYNFVEKVTGSVNTTTIRCYGDRHCESKQDADDCYLSFFHQFRI